MNEDELRAEIAQLKTKLTGNIFEDGEVQQQIYELKKVLNPKIVLNPEEDEDQDCESCGS